MTRKVSKVQIKRYEPDEVIQGLLDGSDYQNRVAGSCIYTCPHCHHRIRFLWKHFYKADERSFIKKHIRPAFDKLMPDKILTEHGFLDFHCPTCKVPTRITFDIDDYTLLAYHFDIHAVFVGERDTSS